MLNHPAAISDEAITHLPQLATTRELDNLPSGEEVSKAIKQMTSGKAPCPDATPPEVLKSGCEAIKDQLTSLYHTRGKQEQLPQEFNTSAKEIASPVTTTEESPSCP